MATIKTFPGIVQQFDVVTPDELGTEIAIINNDINQLNQQVEANTTTTSVNANLIINLQGDVSSNTTKITNNSSAIDTNITNIASHETQIRSLQSLLHVTNNRSLSNQTAIDAANKRIQTNIENITKNTTSIEDHENRIQRLEADVKTIKEEIIGLQEQLFQIPVDQEAWNWLVERVNTLESVEVKALDPVQVFHDRPTYTIGVVNGAVQLTGTTPDPDISIDISTSLDLDDRAAVVTSGSFNPRQQFKFEWTPEYNTNYYMTVYKLIDGKRIGLYNNLVWYEPRP